MAKKPSKYPDEQKLADLIKNIKDAASKAERELTESEQRRIDDAKAALGKMKFARLVEKRMDSAMSKINNVGALAGKNYVYTPQQAEQVVNTLKGAVESVYAAFNKPQGTRKIGGFKLTA